MLNFDTAKTIAAFGGLALGIVNLGLSVYKDFWRTGKIKVNIELAQIKWRGAGNYDFQINLQMTASGKDIYLKKIYIEHTRKNSSSWLKEYKYHINKFITHSERELVKLADERYEEEVKSIFKEASYVRDFCIQEGSLKSITITDRILSERFSDGWDEMPLTGWSLVIEYGEKVESVGFDFNNICISENHYYDYRSKEFH
jgi:hypothetical protein